MNAADTILLLPLFVVGAVAVLVLLAIAFCRNHHLVLTLTVAGFGRLLRVVVGGRPLCSARSHTIVGH